MNNIDPENLKILSEALANYMLKIQQMGQTIQQYSGMAALACDECGSAGFKLVGTIKTKLVMEPCENCKGSGFFVINWAMADTMVN